MGGLRKEIPFTFWMMMIGTLALTGVGIPLTTIGFAGYVSKDAIIEASYASHRFGALYAFICVVVAAGFTSFYSWRLVFMTFFGSRGDRESWMESAPAKDHGTRVEGHDPNVREHADDHAHGDHAHGDLGHDDHAQEDLGHGDHGHGDHAVHESPLVMLIPLAVLALGAVFAGDVFRHWFIGGGVEDFWRHALFFGKGNTILEEMEHVPFWVSLSPTVFMLIGFVVAWYMYIANPAFPRELASMFPDLYRFLLNKWYFDELYDRIFVRPAFWIGRMLWKGGDGAVIDGLGPNGVAARVLDVTRGVVKLQSGYIYQYAFAMLLGVAAFATWYLFTGVR